MSIILVIGEPFWCVIHRCEINNAATTLRISAKAEHIHLSKIEDITLDDLLPGTKVEFIIDKVSFNFQEVEKFYFWYKITANGIHGKFLNNYFGHIDFTQLVKSSDDFKQYKEGHLVTAFVLYLEQATKVTHLSLNNLDPVPPPNLNIGDILKAEVTCFI